MFKHAYDPSAKYAKNSTSNDCRSVVSVEQKQRQMLHGNIIMVNLVCIHIAHLHNFYY